MYQNEQQSLLHHQPRYNKTNGGPFSGRRLPNIGLLYGRGADRHLHTSSTESQQPLNPSYDSRDSSLGPQQRMDPSRQAIFVNRT